MAQHERRPDDPLLHSREALIKEVSDWQKRVGKEEPDSPWRKPMKDRLSSLLADYVMLGGGNAKKLKHLPPGVRLGHNLAAFRGGFWLWNVEDVQTLSAADKQSDAVQAPVEWRVL
ncbi:MAG: hypothetical protein ACRERD_15225 [Candidatus Binatia bacterium]